MTERDAITRAVTLMAEAAARTLGTVSGSEARAGEVTVSSGNVDPLEGLSRPIVTVQVAFASIVEGDNLFVLEPAQAKGLAGTMMGTKLDEGAELGEIELSAIGEAMNQMMGSACAALSDSLAISADITPPDIHVLEEGDAQEFVEAAYVARFTLEAGDVVADVVQLIPVAFAWRLAEAYAEADRIRDVVDGARPGVPENVDPVTLDAVERTARITAEAAASVLSALLGEEASATLPSVEVEPDDPFAKLSYPFVAVEVAYVSGVTGANLFVLSPDQAGRLAAIMMGVTEPMGDGLSEIELSAVSESMNQMMGAATNVMADTLTMAIEVSPPVCTVVESADAARALFQDCAFCARFRLLSGSFTADLMQLVSADFASHLRTAFSTADAAASAVAGVTSPPFEMAAEPAAPVDASAGWTGLELPVGGDRELLRDIRVRVSAELGRARLEVGRVATLPPGAVVKLDRAPADALDVLVNGCPFAQARLVLVDGEYAIQIVSLAPLEAAA